VPSIDAHAAIATNMAHTTKHGAATSTDVGSHFVERCLHDLIATLFLATTRSRSGPDAITRTCIAI
jgi:hypothetical protein